MLILVEKRCIQLSSMSLSARHRSSRRKHLIKCGIFYCVAGPSTTSKGLGMKGRQTTRGHLHNLTYTHFSAATRRAEGVVAAYAHSATLVQERYGSAVD